MQTVLGIIFADAHKKTLVDLTQKRSAASLPYGGRYRQVDFALSNMSNAGIRHVGIFTSHNYHSLMNHIGSAQEWDMEIEETGLEYLSPSATTDKSREFLGRMDAMNAAESFFEVAKEEYVIMADGGILCAIDLKDVLRKHVESGADLTMVIKDGVTDGKRKVDMAARLDSSGRVAELAVDFCPGKEYYAATGIYVMKREDLLRRTAEACSHSRYNLERDLILQGFNEGKLSVNTYLFDGVVMYNESSREYFENSLALLKEEVRNGLFKQPNLTIYTKVRDQVPVYYGEDAEINDCIVADGCVLEGKAENCVLFRGVKIGRGAVVRDCVIMADTVIGPDCDLRYLVLDKDITVKQGMRICGTREHPLVFERGEKL